MQINSWLSVVEYSKYICCETSFVHTFNFNLQLISRHLVSLGMQHFAFRNDQFKTDFTNRNIDRKSNTCSKRLNRYVIELVHFLNVKNSPKIIEELNWIKKYICRPTIIWLNNDNLIARCMKNNLKYLNETYDILILTAFAVWSSAGNPSHISRLNCCPASRWKIKRKRKRKYNYEILTFDWGSSLIMLQPK